MTKELTPFRAWVNNVWYDNCRERETYGEECYKDVQVYFSKFKYFLKREYQYRKRNNLL